MYRSDSSKPCKKTYSSATFAVQMVLKAQVSAALSVGPSSRSIAAACLAIRYAASTGLT
jgi:hypothetical protein